MRVPAAPIVTTVEATALVRRARRQGERDGFGVLVTPRQVRAILQCLGEWDTQHLELVRIWDWIPMTCTNIGVGIRKR